MQIRAAIYCRISEDRANGWGIADQEHHCRRLAGVMGWNVVGVYQDNDIGSTGRTRKRRNDYERLCAHISAGKFEAVLVTELSILHRRPLEWRQFRELGKARRLKIKSLSDFIDLDTGEGAVGADLRVDVDEEEVEQIWTGVGRKSLSEAKEGRPHSGGIRPFGYKYDNGTLIIIPEEAALVREAASRVRQDESLAGICADWQQRGITTPKGNMWVPTTLRQTLLRRSLAGYREHPVVGTVRANWAPILSEDEWERVQSVLTDPSRLNRGRVNVRTYLLTGYVFCGLCDQPLRGGPRSVITGARAYSCRKAAGYKGCGRIKRQADPLEKEVAERLLFRLNSHELRASLAAPDDKADRREREEIERTRAKIGQISDDYTDGTFTKEEYLRQKARLQQRLEEVEGRVSHRQSSYTQVPLADEPVRDAWESHAFDWRRALINVVIEKVIVLPQRVREFDPNTVKVIWKD